MRMKIFAGRNTKEIIRDPLTLFFGIAFPLVLLVLLWAIGQNIPAEAGQAKTFGAGQLAPGIAVFGLSFVTLFSAMLVSKDRSDSLMLRLMTSPMTATDFIAGYTLPLLPMAMVQIITVLIVAIPMGLAFSLNLLLTVAVLIPAALFFIGMGLLFGSVLTDKQVGGICGALMTNLCAWLSGIWFDTALVGKVFDGIANALPFVHAVNAARSAAAGNYGDIMADLWWVIAYAVLITIAAVFVFKAKMRGKNV